MLASRLIPSEMKTCIVKVTSYEHRCVRGAVYNPCFEGYAAFESPFELFRLLDGLFDDLKFPQNVTKRRSFGEEPPAPDLVRCPEPETCLAAFRLSVQFRQNAGWQGSLAWLEGKAQADFRSVLELMYLLDSALEKSEPANS